MVHYKSTLSSKNRVTNIDPMLSIKLRSHLSRYYLSENSLNFCLNPGRSTCEKSNQAVPLSSAEHKKSFLNNYLPTRPESIVIYHCFLSGTVQEESFPNRESLMSLPQTKKISRNIFAASLMVKG